VNSFGMRRPLGKTGLAVSPLGIGGGGGIDSASLLYAFDRGINYFFFSSDMHHFVYSQSAGALRRLCSIGSAVRNEVVLATVTYVNDPEKLQGILLDQFRELGVDYIDIFHWGWVHDGTDFEPLLATGTQLKNGSEMTYQFRQHLAAQQRVEQVNDTLLRRGLVRFIGASFHSRQAARCWLRELDVLMLRYNISHTGVEGDVFPHLTGDRTRDPGIVVFNTAHEGSFHFDVPPPGCAPTLFIPRSPDCYRFALSNPSVDLVLTGVRDRQQVDEALQALRRGPLEKEEMYALRLYGALHTISRKKHVATALAPLASR
jgi:predicted aldo/keto reductase-like oxidoreductase